MKPHNHGTFQSQMNIGMEGEEIVAKYLSTKWEVQDLRSFITMREIDVDFRITNPSTGEKYYVEVKTDKFIDTTNNLLLEMRFPELEKNGWFNRTAADFIAFVSYYTEEIYIFSMNDMRAYLAQGGIHETKVSSYRVGTVVNVLVNVDNYVAAGFHLQRIQKEK